MNLTHASWFSGVGGLDMGLEAAGWETVSFSEIDPYASAVLAHRWPGVANLGSIVDVRADRVHGAAVGRHGAGDVAAGSPSGDRNTRRRAGGPDWTDAFLWTGGFPCQDLSVAGKRRGIVEGSRSGLAITFLDLVERHRPPAIILENVPGLLSSHAGRDFGALLGRLGELGYWWAYRVLDARYFGVPQRRRRVFIVALHAGIGATADSPAEVLSVGSRCDRHPATGGTPGPGVAAGTHVGTLDTSLGHHGGAWGDQAVAAGHVVANGLRASDGHHGHGSPRGDGGDNLVVRPSPDPRGVREADGLAGRLDDRAELVNALDTAQGGADDNDAQAGRLIMSVREDQRTGAVYEMPYFSSITGGGGKPGQDYHAVRGEFAPPAPDAELLPDGLDSHRYRCCGNGVVAPVAEFVGERLRVVVERLLAERAA